MDFGIVRKRLGVIVGLGAAIVVAIPGMALAQAAKMGAAELLPPNAKPGECYARVFVPAAYKTETAQVITREASERVEIIPARYERVIEQVLVREASKKVEVVPETYDWVEEKILVKPAFERIVEVPAVYETVKETVVDRPAHSVWKKGTGPIQKVDYATGEIMCLVEVPATYKTVTKTVIKTPATTRKVEIPAEYTTVRKQVKTPSTTREVTVPAEYKSVETQKLVSPAEEKRVQIPAEQQTVTKTVVASEGRIEWQSVLCETNASPELIKSMQLHLRRAGHYSGKIDGKLSARTMAAVRSFQRAKGLPTTGQLTMETLQTLGVRTGG
ncbi:MAG: peptidoglycan-binding protein [Acidobacteria bacterium]|jgi:Putative peptidoglycan binding domain|nr:MAG: peptidoglycan-binding protein [Acidobacteriota bacterium]